MAALVVHRLSGGSRLVIEDPTALAAVYFGPGIVGSRFAPYDEAAAADTYCDQITDDDISVINPTFGARSPHSAWVTFTKNADPLEALRAIRHDWSLLEMSQAEWVDQHVADRIAEVLRVLRGSHRNTAVLSKVLHLKRPALIPVLDSLIGEQVGWTPAVSPVALIEHLRREGMANLDALQATQSHLRTLGVERTLVRILDALLWISHPSASLASRLDGWTAASSARQHERGGCRQAVRRAARVGRVARRRHRRPAARQPLATHRLGVQRSPDRRPGAPGLGRPSGRRPRRGAPTDAVA